MLETIVLIKSKYINVEFHFVGTMEEKVDKFTNFVNNELIIYHGMKENVHNYIQSCHILINIFYHEGMSNVLLEASSTDRSVLVFNISGCKEIFDEGISGLVFETKIIMIFVKHLKNLLIYHMKLKKVWEKRQD